jgi:uncharacterized protein YfdQ (DUF2303 family)
MKTPPQDGDNNPQTTLTEAEAIQRISEAAAAPVHFMLELPHGKQPLVAVSKQVMLHSMAYLMPAPLRPIGNVSLLSLADLHSYINRLAGSGSGMNPVVYADRNTLRFTAILNHHAAGAPGWMDFRATVALVKSRQLKIWQAKNGQKMTQEAFALFLEEYIEDIREPEGAAVLTFAETLEATRTEVFKSSIITATGEMKLAYSSERNGEQCSTLITEITLGIPLFDGDEPFAVKAKISHRVTEGKLTFWFDLRHIDYLIDTAWKDKTEAWRDTHPSAEFFHGEAPAAQEAQRLSSSAV